MDSNVIQLLNDSQWNKAIPLLIKELSNPSLPKANSAYNLICCYINLGDLKNANQIFKAYKAYLSTEMKTNIQVELKGLQVQARQSRQGGKSEIGNGKPLPSKAKVVDGDLREIAWFTSTTKFSDVIGLENAKKQLKERVIGPMQNPALYARYGAAASSGTILYGPPGGGKTLISKAIAGEANSRMLIVNISEVVSKYMGSTSKNISNLLDEGRKQTPALIFIDEIDSLAQSRTDAGEGTTTSPEEKRILDTFLTELDGATKSNKGLYFVGATNIPWTVDLAFKRSGRFGKSVYLGGPTQKDRELLFKYYLKNKNIKKINYSKLALLTFGFMPADIRAICEAAATQKASATHFEGKSETPITNSDIIVQIKEMGTPTLPGWYQETAVQLSKLPREVSHQYPELKKDILFWETKGQQRIKLYKILASLMP